MSNSLKWLIFATMLITSVAGNGPAEAIETLDVNNLSINWWNQIQKEMADREATRVRVGFYALGKESIEIRAVADPASSSELAGFRWMKDRKGKRQQVAEKAEIDSKDIYGVLIEKTEYRGQKEYEVSLHFKQESWDKVSNVTQKYLKKHLALVRGGDLLSAPMIQEAITSSARIFSEFDSDRIDEFKKGFIALDDTALETWHKKSIEWLEERNKRNPNDIAIMSWLAREHYTGKPRNCERALTLYENILQNKSVEGEHLANMQTCYTELHQYDRASAFYESIVPLYKDENELHLRTQMAQIYMLKGDGLNAVAELEKCLKIEKELPLPYYDYAEDGPRARMLNEARVMKEQAIQRQEELIQKVRDYFNLGKP